jgi:hypothetical protein
MDTIRTVVVCFAVSILVTAVGRLWYATSAAYGGVALDASILVAGVLWLLGASYGYHAVRHR